jgi:F0F1-type ATP synthase membrane subunit a
MPSVGSLLVKPIASGVAHAREVMRDAIPSQDLMQHTKSVDTHDVSIVSEVSDSHIEDAHTEISHEAHLLPLFRANNADLNTTFALGIITMTLIQYYGIAFHGLGGYLKKFFNFSSPIMFFVGILELISEFSRILSFAFRLFGNVLAGEVLIAIVAFLLPSVFSFFLVPFYVLEMMASTIQALVFTMISAVLLNMATTKAHH